LDQIEYQDFISFCKQSYGQKTDDFQQKIRLSLLNIKAYCRKTGKQFITLMGRRDSQGNGLVPRQAFTIQMREVLPDNLNEINLLANTYSQPYSGMIEYRKMNDDLLRLDDSSTSSSNSLIRQFIWNYKVSIKQTLKGVFDMHSAKTIMSFKDLNDLLVKGGFSSPNREFVEGFMKTYSHQHGGVLTFFDFLSAFDAKTIETEIALILRRHEIIWLDVKKTVQTTFNTTISQKFSACNMVSTLVQELEKMPAMADKKIALLDLVRVFADPVLGNDKLDRHALKLAEDTVTQASFQMFAPQLKPDTSMLIVPGSTITFKKLKSLQKYVQSLDDDCQSLLKTPLLQVFKKRDPKNVGKVPLDGFL
jgi:hypothetical protein